MHQRVRAAFVAGVVGAALVSATAEAEPSKSDRVEVCHRQGQGRWKLQSLKPEAAAAHMGHGDGVPLGVVPGSLGLKFDGSCVPVPFSTVYVAGPEQDAASVAGINEALDAFSARSGVPTTYIGLEDLQTVVDEAIDTGAAPEVMDPDTGDLIAVDVLFVNLPNAIEALAASGAAVPASAQTASTAAVGWSADWLNYGTVDGILFGVPNKSDVKSLVWYKESTFRDPAGTPYSVPTTFDDLVDLTNEMIENGQTPWCVGIESGQATGWNFTDWVEIRLLGSESPQFYDDWVANDVGFDDPRIRKSWNEVLDLWNTPGAVFEGIGQPAPGVGIAKTNFFDSVFNLVNDDCLMHRQAQFISFAFDPGDARTFPFPADRADSSPVMGVGNLAVALRHDVEVALVHEYVATAAYADARHTAQPGQGFVSAVKGQDLSALGPFERSFTETLLNADVFRFDASDLMPPEIAFGPIEQVGAPFDFPPYVIVPSQPTGFWGEGTRAVIGSGNTAFEVFLGFEEPNVVFIGDIVGKTVDDATHTVADLFCAVAPGDSC